MSERITGDDLFRFRFFLRIAYKDRALHELDDATLGEVLEFADERRGHKPRFSFAAQALEANLPNT